MIEVKNPEFDNTISYLQTELAKLRTGRANPVMIENVQVDYYGQTMPLKQLGNISVPEPRQLLIQPWDKNALGPIEKAIRDADLGFNPSNEGDKVRITVPELNEERRGELVKMVNKIAEEARVRIRNTREDLWKEIQKQEENGEISEDDKFSLKDKLQEIVDEYNKQIKEYSEKKEQEIMTV